MPVGLPGAGSSHGIAFWVRALGGPNGSAPLRALKLGRAMDKRTFRIILVKPSHYDDDGYVIQWWLSTIPSNSLASVYGLLAACAQEKTLGPDVDIELEAYDECNKIIDVKAMAKRIKAGGGGFVGLVGVQSNQFPRAVDLARAFRALDVPVVIGGFHVSGCISMLPELPPDLKEAQALGVTLFAGEGEGRMADLLRDIDAGQAKPLYNYLHDMPSMEAAVIPVLPKHVIGRIVGHHACFDAGRGCPFQCSFCTIINVQGRKSRYRTADDVEAIVRANYAQGINHYFVTDDNFARNRNWESILDRLIDLRENKGIPIKLILQVDTLCHRIPGFIEKAARAGCNQVFVGLESVNPESLQGAKKRQNKIWEYRVMLQAWRKQKVMTWAGLITGFPTDTPESIARDIEIIKKELPLDILEFFFLTPLPGSEDHKVLYHKGVPMDPDMNKYDLEHVTTGHPRMSPDQWTKGLSRRLQPLLLGRACRDDSQARRRHGLEDEQGCRRNDGLLLRRAHRGRPPAAMRHRAAQGEDEPPAWNADRQSADLLSRARGRVRVRGRAMADGRVALSPDQEARHRGSREQDLCRRRDAPDDGRGGGERRTRRGLRR